TCDNKTDDRIMLLSHSFPASHWIYPALSVAAWPWLSVREDARPALLRRRQGFLAHSLLHEFSLAQPGENDRGHDQDVNQAAQHSADDRRGKRFHHFSARSCAPHD